MEDAVALDQWRGQAFLAVHEFVDLPSLDARLALVHVRGLYRFRADQFAVLHLQKRLTAAAALGAGGRDESIVHGGFLQRWSVTILPYPPGETADRIS